MQNNNQMESLEKLETQKASVLIVKMTKK